MHRDGISHIVYTMVIENGLWYHECDQGNIATGKINRMNDVHYSNILHGRLAHVDGTTTTTIHNYIKEIDIPIKRYLLFKYRSYLPHKMCKHSHKHKTKPKLSRQIEKIHHYNEESLEHNIMDGLPKGVPG